MRNPLWRFMFLAVLPAAGFGGTDWSKFDLSDPASFAQGQITVRFADGVNLDEQLSVLAATGITEVGRIERLNALHLRLPEGADVLEAIRYYEEQPDVLYAEPVMVRHVFWTPNDPNFALQWHFDSGHLNMPAAWDKERGSSSVIIAIVDTGIAFEDYAIPSSELGEVLSDDGMYHKAPDFTSSQFVAGYDFVHEDSHPNDQYGHGTHVAGTVAQATNNSVGVAGMAPDCKLMPVQVLGYDGSGYDYWIADGITWAADNGAHVINLSLGGAPGVQSSIEHDAIKYAVNTKGVVVVAAAGNTGDGIVSYPGGFEECICVAALDYNDELSYYSQYGTGLDISAPGGDVTVDENNDGYADGVLQNTFLQAANPYEGILAKVDEFAYQFFQGTSMATPHVAGLAGLLISHGITGVSNVKNAIYQTARDLGSTGYDTYYGYGVIDPSAALDYGGGGDVVIEVPVLQNPLLSQYVDIWVVPTTGTLTSAPDVTVTLNGSEESVTMQSVSAGYVGDYKFTEAGTATIDVDAGGTTKSRTFGVDVITAAGGVASSPDGRMYIAVPKNALADATFITLVPEKTESAQTSNPYAVHSNQNARGIGSAYRIGPEGASLSVPVSIRIRYTEAELGTESPSTLTLMRYGDGGWQQVPSFIDRGACEVVASVEKLGVFQLASDPTQSTPDLPRVVELTLLNPNPHGSESLLCLALAEETAVSLHIYDASGRMVKSLADAVFPAGEYRIPWNATDDAEQLLPGGVYFARLQTPALDQTLKLVRVH